MTISVTNTTGKLDQSSDLNKDVVLSVKGVSKKFCRDLKRSLLYGVQDMAGEVLGKSHANQDLRAKEFWALQDVSFELKRGEALGLVGKNGSGKSTLLRIIAGLIKPDKGTVEINGRVAPLIALGAGFNPILTGRENIYANMSILGLSKQEIDERFDDVVEFAEIGEAIDSPVQSYSSGMAARLGFASAVFTDPDILLVDEVLAVGDIRFRAKCFRKLATLKKQGTSFILVSHNSHHIFQVCQHAIYLLSGKVILSGDTDSVIKKYEEDIFISDIPKSERNYLVIDKEYEKSDLRILNIYFMDSNENHTSEIKTGEFAKLCVKCESKRKISNINLTIVLRDLQSENSLVCILSNLRDKVFLAEREYIFVLKMSMPYVCLRPSKYVAEIQVREGELHTFVIQRYDFIVKSDIGMSQCTMYQPRQWLID